MLRRDGTLVVAREYSYTDFDGFASLYAKVFAEPPWFEKWSTEDIMKEVNGYFDEANLSFTIAVLPTTYPEKEGFDPYGERVVGFSVAYQVGPGRFPPELAEALLAQSWLYKRPIIYGDELAVDAGFRGMGIGTMLMEQRFEAFNMMQDAIFIGRTDENSKMVSMYKSLGYENTRVQDLIYRNRYYYMKGLYRSDEVDRCGRYIEWRRTK